MTTPSSAVATRPPAPPPAPVTAAPPAAPSSTPAQSSTPAPTAPPDSSSAGRIKIPSPDFGSPIIPLLLIGAGGYLLWFGVRYWRGTGAAVWPSYPIKSVLQGKGLPAQQPGTPPGVEVTSYETALAGADQGSGGAGGSGSSAALASDAEKYQGVRYAWGKATPAGWDCSGMVNWCAGHDLSLQIPGVKGRFDGSSHGPDVAEWINSPLVHHVAGPGPGVLAAWGPNEHMGICLSSTEMISALNPALGTAKTPIAAAHTGLPVFLAIKAASGGTNPTGKPQHIAQLLLARFGWGADQMPSLVRLWDQESNWSPIAQNPGSGALGIAQALGHGTTGTAGKYGNEYGPQYGLSMDQARQANSGNPLQQIRWGLGYIKATYGTPDGAWAHERAHNWY